MDTPNSRQSTHKQFLHDAEYWVEVEHKDICAYCRDMGSLSQCASAPSNAERKRTRVAMFVYFMEAIDYAQECNRRGTSVWLRKPRFTQAGTESDYSFYDANAKKLQTPVVLDGKPGIEVEL